MSRINRTLHEKQRNYNQADEWRETNLCVTSCMRFAKRRRQRKLNLQQQTSSFKIGQQALHKWLILSKLRLQRLQGEQG